MFCRNIAATILTESQLFDIEQKTLKAVPKVELSSILVDSETNSELCKTCDNKVSLMAKKTSQEEFKDKGESIKPILLYTSEVKVKPSDKSATASLYNQLNKFLREQNFALSCEEEYKQKWEYQFANQLLEQLRLIKAEVREGAKKELWRGVSYSFTQKRGEIVSFKQFVSVSTSEAVAKRFASQALFKIVSSHSARPIKQFSFYGYEEEYLF